MGALLVASVSSFTSCKDYDDDINSLKESVAKAALQSNLDALTTTVNGVKTTADQALTTANAAATKAELSAAKSEALAKAAEGITNAATAQAAADAAKALAQEAKTAAESIDLTPYVTKTELAETAEAAKKEITNALANYLTADAIEKKLEALKEEVAAANEEQLAEMQTKVKNATEAVNSIWGAVTDVSLVVLGDEANVGGAGTSAYDNLTFVGKKINKNDAGFTRFRFNTTSAAWESAKDGVFGENDYIYSAAAYSADKKTFTNGAYVKFPTKILVRVSPSNAVLTADAVKIVNSKGVALGDIIQVESVEEYDGLLTRSTTGSGLWYVNLVVKDGTTTANITKATTTTVAGVATPIAYAFAVNNTADVEASADRAVVSEYAISFQGVDTYVGPTSLAAAKISSAVSNKTPAAIAGYKNRITVANGGTLAGVTYDDYNWGAVPAVALDNRSGNPNFAVNNGEQITIDMSTVVAATLGGVPTSAKYFYVTLDKKQAVTVGAGVDAASEINAWNSYAYTGLNKTVDIEESTKVTFSCTIPGVVGDEVAFRLYAVNYDGTLVDPDGYGFVVYVGGNSAAATAAANVKPLAGAAGAVTVMAPITGTLQNGTVAFALNAGTNDYSTDADGDSDFGTINAPVAGGAFTITLDNLYKDLNPDGTGKTATAANKYGDAKYVQLTITPTAKWTGWGDDATQKMTLITKAANGVMENSLTIDLTKVLPTAADAPAWSWKDNQKVNGVYTAYMYPESAQVACDNTWTTAFSAATWAYKSMNNVFNGLCNAAATSSVPGFEFSYANTVLDADNKYTLPLVVVDAMKNSGAGQFYVLTLNAAQITALMDGTTQHDTKLGFNFGEISSVADKNKDYTGAAATGYTVDLDTYKTVYDCPLNTTVQKYTIGQQALAKWTESTLMPGTGVWKEGDKVAVNYIIYNQNEIATDKAFYQPVWEAGQVTPADLTDPNAFTRTTTPIRMGIELSKCIVASNGYDNSKFADGGFAGTTAEILDNLYVGVTATVISNGSNAADYYTVAWNAGSDEFDFTRLPSATTNPAADVASKFNLNLVDAFGHTHKYAFDFSVKRAQ